MGEGTTVAMVRATAVAVAAVGMAEATADKLRKIPDRGLT
jgi:hypothetical protein